ncbi:MAG: chemotaxis protein CheX [Nitrospinota bacterium]|nr:chemotaxis protein CheX [Nitrospinota bacterium]
MKRTPAPPKVSSDHLSKLEVGKIVKAFMESVEEVLETMGMTRIEARTKAATLTEHAYIKGDAAGSLAFTGDYSGLFIISFDKKAICEITTNMLFAEKPYTNHRDADVEGSIGELTNQMNGVARNKINKLNGWKANAGIPSVIVGENISWALYASGTLVIHIPYTTPQMNELYVEVAVSDHPTIGEIKI